MLVKMFNKYEKQRNAREWKKYAITYHSVFVATIHAAEQYKTVP